MCFFVLEGERKEETHVGGSKLEELSTITVDELASEVNGVLLLKVKVALEGAGVEALLLEFGEGVGREQSSSSNGGSLEDDDLETGLLEFLGSQETRYSSSDDHDREFRGRHGFGKRWWVVADDVLYADKKVA